MIKHELEEEPNPAPKASNPVLADLFWVSDYNESTSVIHPSEPIVVPSESAPKPPASDSKNSKLPDGVPKGEEDTKNT